MQKSNLHTPLLFVVFNRLETTKKVFQAIKKVKPAFFYIAADGARSIDEDNKCQEVRNYILNNIDWECEVKTLFREKNLGCRTAVSSAIDWFFENVEEGIILEDDCLPNPDFFRFCQELLEYYRNNTKIMHIGGCNFQPSNKTFKASYYFSRYAHIWGWATWKRSWKYYDVNLTDLDEKLLQKTFCNRKIAARWFKILQDVKSHREGFNTWDFQWNYALFSQKALAIIPKVNLVSNIGFFSGTHDLTNQSEFSEMDTFSLDKKIIHPVSFIPDEKADKYIFKKFYQDIFSRKLINKFKRMFK
jgi:hypothetical protein